MSYMDTHAAFAPPGGMKELTIEEIDLVWGGYDRNACIAMTSVVGGVLGAILGGGFGSIVGGGAGAWYGTSVCKKV